MAKMDKSVGDILKSYKIDLDEATWDCHGTLVIYHRYLERIADKAGITFDEPREIHIDAKAKEVVLCVRGHMGDNESWSYGEVMPYNNTNPYPFAMAEKRAKDRVILKLAGLSGHVYSEEEADDFKKGPPAPPVKSQVKAPSVPVRPPSPRGGPRPTPPPKKEAEILTVEKDLSLDERTKLLQECLTDHPAGIGRGAIQKATGFSLPQFNETISALREDGKVELRGQKRGAKWHWVADKAVIHQETAGYAWDTSR